MSAPIINRVVLLGNLTKDPEVRALASGTNVCRLRVACSTRHRNTETGDWEERPNFFDVSVFGPSGDACGTYLEKGRPIAIDGRLSWSEWESAEGQRRQSVEIVAESVQFLGAPRAAGDAAAEHAAAIDAAEEALAF